MRFNRKVTMAALVAASAASLLSPGFAFASAGSATLTPGTLTVTTPAAPAFTATLTGVAQAVTQSQSMDVLDNTGSGLGWNVTLAATQFVITATPTKVLPTTAVTETVSGTTTCDVALACTVATSGASITLPLTIASTATKILSAAVGTGLAPQTTPLTFSLAIPANASAGVYASTWTYSSVSAP
jgi:WxL domain surface cell wall-binding